ncbi:hypothetical protein WA588_005031 [Blastocystis sp. NMH]
MPCFSSLPRKDTCSLSYEVEPSDEYLYVQPPLPAYAPRQSPATIPPYSSYSNPVLLPRVRSSEESNHRPFSSTSDSVSPFPPLPPEELQTSTCLSPPAKQPVPPKSVPNRTKRSKKCKAKGGAEHYVIDPQRVLSNEDSRQFLMIKNIPNSILQDRLLFILEQFVRYQIEFLYLPIDRTTECNLGYGYVSLVDSRAVLTLYQAMHGKRWPNSSSLKLCEIVYARIQGHRDYVKMCDKWTIMNDSPKYHPVFFRKVECIANGCKRTRMIRSSYAELTSKRA